MSTETSEISNDAHRASVLKALKKSKGRVTIGDVVAGTGLPRDDAETALRSLLKTHEGHLDVSEDGELIYLFDPKLVRRDHRSAWQRFKDKAWAGFMGGFKVWIMLMLTVYFAIYVTLAIAAFVAIMSQDRNNSRSSSFGRRGGGGLPIHWLLYIFWTPDWHYGTRYYGDTSNRRAKTSEAKAPFYKKVFAYVFGPDQPELDANEDDRRIASFIRSQRGVITAAELVEFTGDTYAEADSKLGHLMGAFNGDAHISEEGEVVYAFPELMLSAEGEFRGEHAAPAWHKLEVPKKVTGNKKKADGLITFFNAFNLVFALISPAVLFPILGIAGQAATIGLVIVPLIFSLLFFAVPGLRYFGVKKENARRHARNVRKLVLKPVFESAGPPTQTVDGESISSDVARSLTQVKTEGDPTVITSVVRQTVAEFDGDIDLDDDGRELYRFPAIALARQESQLFRDKLALDRQEIGEIVYSSADTAEQAEERELREFEKELAGSDASAVESLLEEEEEVGIH